MTKVQEGWLSSSEYLFLFHNLYQKNLSNVFNTIMRKSLNIKMQ